MHHPSHPDDSARPADNSTAQARWEAQWTVDIWGPRKSKAPRPPRGGEQL